MRDTYLITKMNDLIDSLGPTIAFPRLECNMKFWQIPTPEQVMDKTISAYHVGTYRSRKRLFALIKASATFQELEILCSLAISCIRTSCTSVMLLLFQETLISTVSRLIKFRMV